MTDINNDIKICHLTSVHKRNDIRIFIKQCLSLSKKFNTSLIVADDLSDEKNNGIHIYDVGKETGRIRRVLVTTNKIYQKALTIDADIYHLHDPELLLIALKLKRKGKKVVFDAHEDVPKQILSKPYLNSFKAKTMSIMVATYEKYVCKKLDFILTATPFIRDKFKKINQNVVDINNYPILSELHSDETNWNEKKLEVAYVGGISEIRGIIQVISALEYCQRDNPFLHLVGQFSEKDTENKAKELPSFNKVIEHGFKDREEVKTILSRSVAGIVTFLPAPNHIDSQPNKMFEYMSAGIPVVASNFPLWKEIIEKNECGICVNPNNPQEIAEAIEQLFSNLDLAKKMGGNGRSAVIKKYNWKQEEKKLLDTYNKLLKK